MRQTALGRKQTRIGLEAFFIILLFLASIVGSVISMLFAPNSLAATNQLLALTIIAVLFIPIIGRLLAGKRIDIFAPDVILSFILFLSYVVAISIASGENDFFSTTYQISFGNFDEVLNTALLLILSAVTTFRFGYALAAKIHSYRPVQRQLWVIKPQHFSVAVMALTAISLGGLAVAVVLLGGPQTFLANLSNRVVLFTGLNYFIAPLVFMLTIMILWLSLILKQKKAISRPFIAYAIFAILINTMAGSKTNVLSAVLALVIVYHYQKKRLSFLAISIFSSVVIIVAYAFDLFFREYLTVGYFVTVDGLFTPQFFAQLLPAFLGNSFIQLQTLMVMIDGMPSTLPFLNGITFLSIFYAVIPRGWAPEKPPSPAGVFSEAFFPVHLYQGTSIPPSYFGEFYMNFGMVGPAIGGFILGYLMYCLYKGFLRRRRSHIYVAFYAIVLSLLLPVIRGESLGLGVLFSFMFTPLLIIKMVGRYVRRSDLNQEPRKPAPMIHYGSQDLSA